jgi:hypothetical protein
MGVPPRRAGAFDTLVSRVPSSLLATACMSRRVHPVAPRCAACRASDTLVVTKPGRPARSLPASRAIADELTGRQISPSLGGSVY